MGLSIFGVSHFIVCERIYLIAFDINGNAHHRLLSAFEERAELGGQ